MYLCVLIDLAPAVLNAKRVRYVLLVGLLLEVLLVRAQTLLMQGLNHVSSVIRSQSLDGFD